MLLHPALCEGIEDFAIEPWMTTPVQASCRCRLRVHELPAPILSNEDAGPAALLVNRSILVLSFGGGTKGHDGGIPVDADFDLIRDERIEIHAAGLPVLQVLRPGLDVPVRAIMDVVFGQDPLQESDVRLDDSRIEIVDESLTPFVAGRIANDPAGSCHHENRDREKMFHDSHSCSVNTSSSPEKVESSRRRARRWSWTLPWCWFTSSDASVGVGVWLGVGVGVTVPRCRRTHGGVVQFCTC